MDQSTMKKLLEQVAAGEVSADEALAAMRTLPFEDIGFAKIDHHRALRCGVPEVILCEGKSPEQVAAIAERILAADAKLLATRASEEHFKAVLATCERAVYNAVGRCVTVGLDEVDLAGNVLVVTAGTSDIPVAEEAATTARMLGARTEIIGDVGVAGLHRLLSCQDALQDANVIVAVAGMEGALASVIGGLVSRPVIAVPTSVGYGASFGGIAPLLTMLNSCAAGVAVVNIDNGFGAGYLAALINGMAAEPPSQNKGR